MKKKIFLHIGLPKTGTTFLQCQVEFNRNKIADHGVYVPSPVSEHYLLALALQPERWSRFPADISSRLPHVWDRLLKEINENDFRAIFISAESFSWELKKPEQIRKVKQYLGDFDVKVVMNVREPYSFISSMYGHMIRVGRGPYTLDNFLLEFPYFWCTEFQRRRWGEFFGEKEFLTIAYEEIKGERMLIKFLSRLFPEYKNIFDKFLMSPYTEPNISLSPRFLRLLEELQANKINASEYLELYKNTSSRLVPLEAQMLSRKEIDEALERCGLSLEFSAGLQYI